MDGIEIYKAALTQAQTDFDLFNDMRIAASRLWKERDGAGYPEPDQQNLWQEIGEYTQQAGVVARTIKALREMIEMVSLPE